jgi:hypothetical protein
MLKIYCPLKIMNICTYMLLDFIAMVGIDPVVDILKS